jgi:diguanylate cyclase (GGDEF)-like protein/PAS domain S-box-containing protein
VTDSGSGAPQGWLRRFHAAHLHDYNLPATVYWAAMVAVGAAVLGGALAAMLGMPWPSLVQVAVGVACATLAGLAPIHVPRSKNSFAVGEIFIFLLLLLHGAPAAIVAAAVEAFTATLRSSRRWSSRIASPALAAVAMALTGALFERLQWLAALAGIGAPVSALLALLVAAVAYAVIGTVLQTMVFVLKSGQGQPLRDWLTSFGWVGIVYAAAAAVSGLLYVSYNELGIAVLLIAVPIIIGLLAALHLYFRVVDLDEQNRRARVEAAEREAEQAARHVAELRRSEQRFHSAFSHASIGMALVAADGHLLQANAALAALFGSSEAALAGRRVTELVARDEAWPLTEQMGAVLDGGVPSFALEVHGARADGAPLALALHGSVFADDEAGHPCLILQMQDITARRRAEAQLEHIAYHDGLTDLANRTRFHAALQEALETCRAAPGRRCAVLFLDFDRFKIINDSLGHHVGDEFLREVAARLRAGVRPHDLVARLGGDEFAILMHPIEDDQHPVRVAERLQGVLRQPMRAGGHELRTSASIGIRLSDTRATTPQDMLRDADTAMYRAKAAGKACHAVFDASMHAQVTDQLRLEHDLQRALARGEIGVVLQPIVMLGSREVLAYEALARWQHPERGVLLPEHFLGVAEETGLLPLLSMRVLDRACAAVRDIAAAGPAGNGPPAISVNVTALDLCQHDFARRVAGILRQHGVKPQQLSLELTEGMLMERMEAALGTMNALRELGVGLCVDDFGTGYSSLAYLSSLPINMLKIDSRFVHQLGTAQESAEIVRAVVQLGGAMGKTVVAEGIETPEQLARLTELGCRRGQGHLFAQPVEPAGVARMLAALHEGGAVH